jgi:hypothetical protein
VFDFVLTQWGKEYGFDNLRAIKRIDYEREIFFPKTMAWEVHFSIKEDKRGKGLAMCALVRLELKCLMWFDCTGCILRLIQEKTSLFPVRTA